MEFVGRPLAGKMLQALHSTSLDECTEVKAAIAYAQRSTNEILLLEDCVKRGKKLTFYGRADGSCPIDLQILKWFLDLKSPNAVCRLVSHWLHAKVIWWVGQGAYIGSANLTDRAWFKNYEAGIFLTDAELEHCGLTLELESFFNGLDQNSYPLDVEEYERQVAQDKRRQELMRKLRALEEGYEDGHPRLKDKTTPISVDMRKADDRRLAAFRKEWSETLQLIRNIGSRVALAENRPSWVSADVPPGVQGDQFLHAYYYLIVRPMSERNAYQRDYEKHKKNPEAALQSALAWWKTGDYAHGDEEHTIYQSAPLLARVFAKNKITTLSEQEWIEALTHVHAFGDHAGKVGNAYLGLGADPGGPAKSIALARLLWNQRTASGRSAPEVFDFVIWGPGDIAERVWKACHSRDYKLNHVGPNIYGEVVGWARPTEFPPRNSRTSKALCALGNNVSVLS